MATAVVPFPTSGRHRRVRSPTARGAGVLGLYLIPAVIAYWHVWAHPTSVVIGGGTGDQGQSIWYLQWVPWALGHGHNPLFTVVGNYPLGVNLVVQTSALALGFFASPITVLWGPIAAYNVCITLAFPLSAGAGYLLARRFTSWRPAAFAAGCIYGYSPYMVGQGYGHLNLVFVALPPLILLVLHDLCVRQSGSALRYGSALGVLVVCQFFIATEVLATTGLVALVALVIVMLANRSEVRNHLRFAATGLAVAAAVSVAVLAYPIYLLLAGPQHISGATPGYTLYRSAFVGPLIPNSNMVLSSAHSQRIAEGIGGNQVENGSYLGPGIVVIVLAGVVFVRRRAVWVAGLLAVIAFVISIGSMFRLGLPSLAGFGSSVPLPARWLGDLPLLKDAYPIRYTLYVALFAGLVVAMTLDALRARGRALLAGGAAVVALVFLLPTWPYPGQSRVAVPSYFTTSAVDAIPAGSVAVLYPWPDDTNDQAQLWHAESNFRFRMAGGYFLVPSGPSRAFSYSPSTLASTVLDALHSGPAPGRTPALRQQLRTMFAGWDVRSIVAQPVGNDPIGFFTWLTGRPPSATTGGVVAWYNLTWSS